jgi:hypothetical protein
LRDFDPTLILSTHLPPITGERTRMYDTLLEAPQADPFVGRTKWRWRPCWRIPARLASITRRPGSGPALSRMSY